MRHRHHRVKRLVAVGALALLGASCSEASRTAPIVAADDEAESTEEPAAGLDALLAAPEVETVPVFLTRDPFRPIVVASVSGGGGGGEGTPTDPAPGAPTDPPGQTDPGCVTTAAGEVCDGELVELVDVAVVDGVDQADVRVAGNLYTVREGDRFATHYLVESIDPPCVSFLHGDELFTLCEGQRVLK